MGSCISKCKPKKKPKQDHHLHVQDKLIISQDPPITSPVETRITKIPSDKPLSPAPSTTTSSSSASFSSFSNSTISKYAVASSISSSSSSSSSYCSSVTIKDRSFSNEFLYSCAKENPHAIGFKEKSSSFAVSSPLIMKTKQNVQENATIRKRVRASSPTLVRRKSFRKEQNLTTNRGLRSPSPSRRFNGESNRIFPVKESGYRKTVGSTPKRESFRAPMISSMRRNDVFSQQICSRIDGVGREMDVVMEDINNPLIALDCFIFL